MSTAIKRNMSVAVSGRGGTVPNAEDIQHGDSTMSVKYGREISREPNTAEKLEWLVTNGIGGYASGTVAGTLTRRYHGLLVAALKPPLGRNLLVTKFDETAVYNGKSYPLSANRWSDGTVDPHGYQNIESFHLEGTIPVWSFAIADAILRKRIWMKQGENTTYIRYELARASRPLELGIKAYVNYRDYHGTTRAGDWKMTVRHIDKGIEINPYQGATPFYLFADNADIRQFNEWYYGFSLAEERYRGLDHTEDHLHAGTFLSTLGAGEALTIIASVNAGPDKDVPRELGLRRTYEQELIERFRLIREKHSGNKSAEINRLALAADQFVVGRTLPDDTEGKSIIAGYHWFGDWGRDTMISLPGLTISTGRTRIARSVLKTFARYVDMGMLPNRFPDSGEKPEYNTVDATLWYFEAVRQYHETVRDGEFLKELFPVLEDIIRWHIEGTRYNIKADPEDGLLYAGEDGVQLTWMDAKVGDRVVTPRIGKPVEVNALWYNALRSMAGLAKHLKKSSKKYESLAGKALKGFSKFWNEEARCCYDVIDGPRGNDPSLRPNQIFAVSLPESPLTAERQRGVVEACALNLQTSVGLRSLSPDHGDYKGHYGGGQGSRDGAYHQGTVWGWLLGHMAIAHMKVYKDPDAALGILKPMLDQLRSHGIGSLSEIFDGDPPFTSRGCIAQAWTVGESIRAWLEIEKSSAGESGK